MKNKEIIFEVMVTDSDLLRKEIERYNEFNNTNFEIIEIAEEIEAEFCKIKTTADESHIFKLGFGLARCEEELRQEDKID